MLAWSKIYAYMMAQNNVTLTLGKPATLIVKPWKLNSLCIHIHHQNQLCSHLHQCWTSADSCYSQQDVVCVPWADVVPVWQSVEEEDDCHCLPLPLHWSSTQCSPVHLCQHLFSLKSIHLFSKDTFNWSKVFTKDLYYQ